MDVNENEIKEQLKEVVSSFLSQHESTNDAASLQIIPADGGTNLETDGYTTAYTVTKPSGELSPKDIFEHKQAREFSQWLLTSGNGYVTPLYSNGELQQEPDPEEAPGNYLRETRRFIESYVDYKGGFEFDEDVFDVVYEEKFKPNYETTHSFNLVVPVHNLEIEDEKIILEEGRYLDAAGKQNIKKILLKQISICKWRDEEQTGIFTRDSGSFIIGDVKLNAEIEVEVEVPNRLTGIGFEMDVPITSVLDALRLLKPNAEIEQGHEYRLSWENWLAFREGIPMPRSSRIPGRVNKTGNWVGGETANIKASEADALQNFFEKYREYLGEESNSMVSNPLRRHREMYFQKGREEDYFLDCMIGFEETLLKGVRGGYNFWLPLRASILLGDVTEYSPEYIYNFFDPIYGIRNEIVHKDGEIKHPYIEQKGYSKSDINKRMREFLSFSIREYMDENVESGRNIQETNEKLNSEIQQFLSNAISLWNSHDGLVDEDSSPM